MNVYTDPRLLDVHGALESLPPLTLDSTLDPNQAEMKATGTDDVTPRQFAPEFAPNSDNGCPLLSIVDNSDASSGADENEINPEKTSVSQGLSKSGRLDDGQRVRI